MSSFVNFIKSSFVEFKDKVEWLSWKELQKSTTTVVISTIILALFTFAVDTGFSVSIKNLYSFFIELFN